MSGSTYGRYFTVTTWGESHGPAVGAVVDGCPAGLPLCEEDIQVLMDRRKPGQNRFTTARKEEDEIHILSGVFEGKTTGTPISLMVQNKDHRSADYSNIRDVYRPGHADYTFDAKYGFRDYRGGGRSSARETIGRVAAGAIAEKVLAELGVSFETRVLEIGGIEETDREAVDAFLTEQMKKMDSAGGIVQCVIHGVPAGLGDPVFEKMDASLAKAVMSIGAVKGVEIGDGFAVARSAGSRNNDAFCADEDGNIAKKSNHAGGILGGITDGSDIILRAAFKPTPSIAQEQETVNREHENVTISIHGRHDPVVVRRAAVVVEAMAALTVLDLLMANMHATMEGIKSFYQ
ncbi:MAG: chorismate synthase [Lachnospiraceae bacterium]|nr:chorismate synthase [Lachnospiraceae bacterium]